MNGNLVCKNRIPAIDEMACVIRMGIPVIGVTRSDWDDQRLRTHARDLASKNRALDESTFTELASNPGTVSVLLQASSMLSYLEALDIALTDV